MKIYGKYIYSFLLFLLVSVSVFSQNSGKFIEESQDIKVPFTITQYSTKEGLPQSQVLDIVSKKDGSLLISTANGVVEFNGYQFKNIQNNNNYKNQVYVKLYWHEKTKQLFGSELGGSIYQIYPIYKPINIVNASTILNDTIYTINAKGEVFYATVYNLYFKKIFSTDLNYVHSIYKDKNYLLIGTENGFYKLDEISRKLEKLFDKKTLFIKENPYSKDIYFSTGNELYKLLYKSKNITRILSTSKKLFSTYISDIDFINESDFFVSTTEGLYHINSDYTDCYTKRSYLPSQYLQSLYYNKNENCLFVGTGEKGLLKLQLKNNYSFSSKQGFKESASLSSIIKTKKGDVIIGETTGILYKVDMDSVYPINDIKGSYASLAEIDSLVFAGTWGAGIKLINKNTLVGEIKNPQLPNNFVHCVFQDYKKDIWIGTSNGIAKGNSIKAIKPIYKSIKNEIICFYQCKDSSLCIGTSSGAYIIDKKDKIIKHINIELGLEGKEVRCFYEDYEGKLWIGSYGGGLYCYNKDKLVSINKLKNAMLDKDIFCLAKDEFGYFYITSNHGLWRLKEKDLNDFYYKKKDYLIPFYYGEETGVLNTEFNGGFQNNYLKTKHNHFYFPSLEGVVITTPEDITFRKLNIKIDEIFVNDALYEISNHLFDKNTYSVEFRFSSITFLEKYNVYYQYKLEGEKSTNWSPLQKERKVNFKLLPPGKYTFTVRALDGFNDSNPSICIYSFEIAPYFYETNWFKLLMVLASSGLVLIAVRLRVIYQRKKGEQKEIISRQIAELELKAIQSQLNPHFIFNCMNTIKYFLLDKDFDKANTSLNKLSKLIRNSIEESEDFFSSLKDELDLIENYLELEKMRLEDQLQWSIKLHEGVSDTIIIPRLYFQPFVENSVKHGIAHLTSNIGIISIEIKKEKNFLITIITDNGIGRKASFTLKENKNIKENHVSIATQLIKDKKHFLDIYKNYKTDIQIIDLYDVNQQPIGTQVIIKTPINL